MPKFFCVYLAWPKWEVLPKNTKGYDELPTYPRSIARVRVYTSRRDQLECYANIPCPASQTFEADSEEEIKKKVEEFNNNFESEEWLEKNIYPYV